MHLKESPLSNFYPELADDLFQGRGRPYLRLAALDPTPFRETILHACLFNPIFDRQCEGDRVAYLDGLIRHIGDDAWYEPQILAALADPDDEMDLPQLCEWALLMARRGSGAARRQLYESCAEYAALDDSVGFYQLIELDGIEGFLFVAEQLGAAGYGADHYELLGILADHAPPEAVGPALAAARRSRPFVDAYLAAAEHAMAERDASLADYRIMKSLPYAELKPLLAREDRPSSFGLSRWGDQASDADLAAAARDLLAAYEKRSVMAALSVFMLKPFPLDPALLFPLAWDEDEDVAYRALRVLGRTAHPGLRQLSFDLIAAGQQIDGAVRLFAHHFQPADVAVFADLLARTDDTDAVHDLELALRDVFDDQPAAAAAPLLIELAERGPCSLCRWSLINALLEQDALPPALRAECRYDADEDIRKLVVG